MNAEKFKSALSELKLENQEVADLLGVKIRTIQRWIGGEDIPKATEHVLNAWLTLERLGLAWRPDAQSILPLGEEEVRQQLSKLSEHSLDLSNLLLRVHERGGPSAPWVVDLSKRKATLGDMWLSYYLLQNGSFSPQHYGRHDKAPDVHRDRMIIEDGYACIAHALGRINKVGGA